MLLHLPPMDGRGGPRVKNGPALTGHGAEAVRDAITDAITALPDQLRRSLTWDQGAEMAKHAQLRIDTGLPVYFCDPQSPWQPGSMNVVAAAWKRYQALSAATSARAVVHPQEARPRRTTSCSSWATTWSALIERAACMTSA